MDTRGWNYIGSQVLCFGKILREFLRGRKDFFFRVYGLVMAAAIGSRTIALWLIGSQTIALWLMALLWLRLSEAAPSPSGLLEAKPLPSGLWLWLLEAKPLPYWLIGAEVGAEGEFMSGSGVSYFGYDFYILKS